VSSFRREGEFTVRRDITAIDPISRGIFAGTILTLNEVREIAERAASESIEALVVSEQNAIKAREINRTVREETAATIATVRRAASVGILVAQAIGFAINQTFTLMTEIVLLSVEIAIAIQAALAGATLGVSGVVNIGAKAVTIGFLLKTISDIQRGKQRAAQRTAAATGAIRGALY
jgi:hypothetical protein